MHKATGMCDEWHHACVDASQVYFLPNDPFAICVCPGNEEHHPRLIWFNMQDEKLIAELGGKTDSGFGRAGLAGLPGAGSNVPTSEQGGHLVCRRAQGLLWQGRPGWAPRDWQQ